MLYIGVFKRIIPFVLTFVAGLFIASFFVSITAPNFSNWRESRRGRCRDKHDLRLQVDQLRQDKRILEREVEMLKREIPEPFDLENAVPPVVLEAPHPPKRPKHPRHEILR